MVKHIEIKRDTITPTDKRKKPYQGNEYIQIGDKKYYHHGTFLSAGGAEEEWRKEYFNREYVIIPYGAWGNPALPGLFIAER
jgi:hypothetical protein